MTFILKKTMILHIFKRKYLLNFSNSISIIMILFACSSKENRIKDAKTKNNTVVASVGEVELFRDELSQLIPIGTSKQDSTVIAKRFIKQWIQNQLLLEKAKSSDLDDADIDRKVENYRNSLLLDYFEQNYLQQNLDTVISEKEIKTYYKINSFSLQTPIVMGSIIKIQSNNKFKDKIKSLIKAGNSWEKGELKAYCDKFAHNSYLNDSTWIEFEKLVFDSPFQGKSKNILKAKSFFTKINEEFDYFLKIKKVKKEGGKIPLAMVKDRIKDNILNERKIKIKKKLKQEIYEKAKRNKKFKIVTK